MVLSKRERYVGLITAAVIGVLLFDWVIYEPLNNRAHDLDAQIATAQGDLDNANRQFAKKRSAEQSWAQMSRGALVRDESAAESRVLNSVREWASDAGMTLSSMKPERAPEKVGDFYRISFRATGTGQMSQIARFLYHAQTTSLPVRITELSLTSRKEGADDLTASLGIATIYLADAEKSGRGTQTASTGSEMRR